MKHELRRHELMRQCLLGIMVLFFAVSCGQKVKQTISPVVPNPVLGQFKKAVIVPFADYTPASSPYSDWRWRRNLMVLEALQDELFQVGVKSAVEEDVVKYLIDRGIIREPSGAEISVETAALQEELDAEWSDAMKEEMKKVIMDNMAHTQQAEEYRHTQEPLALDGETLKELGDHFGVDYIIRGRIIEFRTGQVDTFDPLEIGLLPFIFKSGQRTIFGIAESDTYEAIDQAVVGALFGALVGDGLDTPYNVLDTDSYEDYNALVWGSVGAMTAYLANKGGRVSEATVQLRALAQDARTGEIIWLNRAEVSVLPKSAYAAHDYLGLFKEAIRQATKSLVDNLVATLLMGSEPWMDVDGLVVSFREDMGETAIKETALPAETEESDQVQESTAEAAEAAKEAKKASAEAAEAAEKADEASKKIERIFEKIIAK